MNWSCKCVHLKWNILIAMHYLVTLTINRKLWQGIYQLGIALLPRRIVLFKLDDDFATSVGLVILGGLWKDVTSYIADIRWDGGFENCTSKTSFTHDTLRGGIWKMSPLSSLKGRSLHCLLAKRPTHLIKWPGMIWGIEIRFLLWL